jgi:hypothetical protein
VFVAVVLAGVGVLVAQVIPTLIEYQAIVKAIERSKDDRARSAIRIAFDRRPQAIDDIKSVLAKDLEIKKVGDKQVVSAAYEQGNPHVRARPTWCSSTPTRAVARHETA